MHKAATLRGTSQQQNGFSLVELLVAIGLFSVVVAIAIGGFTRALRTQRQIAALLAADNNASLAIEQMAREIRTGRYFCYVGNPNTSLNCNAHTLVFVSAEANVVTYCTQGGAIWRSTSGNGSIVCGDSNFAQVTSNNVSVQYLNFLLLGNQSNDGYPPRITISLGVSAISSDPGVGGSVVNLQTTVSARLINT